MAGGYESLAMFESPIQIAIVLLIALVVFGPKRLPEIGKQIGNALRELKKAGNDVMSSFSTDHDPEPYRPEPYRYDNQNSYGYSSQYDYSVPHTPAVESYEAPPDLTDYTIVGLPVSNGTQSESPLDAYETGPVSGSNGRAPEDGASTAQTGAGSQAGTSQETAAVAPAEKDVTDHV